MSKLKDIYRTPLGLLTDLYQITMAYGYWKLGRADQGAVFHLFFREPPFHGGKPGYGSNKPLRYASSYRRISAKNR